jgi:hypothetical protein
MYILDEEREDKEWEQLCEEDVIYIRSKKCEEICPYCGQMFWRNQSMDNKRLLACAVNEKDGKVVAMNGKRACDITRCDYNIDTQQLA